MTNVYVSDYKQIILHYCNRLINERRFSILKSLNNDKKIMYSIKFNQPEWFTELNDDLQYNIVLTVQNHYINLLKNNITHYLDYIYNHNNNNNHNNHNYKKRTYSEMLQTSEN